MQQLNDKHRDNGSMEHMLKKSGYSAKAIEYYTGKVNVGRIPDPSVQLTHKGACGDTMRVYLKIDSGIIREAKFEAIGCAGAFSAGSALMEMVRGKSIRDAENIRPEDIIEHLGGVPEHKRDCVLLARAALKRTLRLYKREDSDR